MIANNKEQHFESLLMLDDRKAFSFLFDSYGGAINGIVRRLLPDNNLADSVFKKIFSLIYKNIHEYDRKEKSLFTWLMLQTRKCLVEANDELMLMPEKFLTNSNIVDLSYGYTKENISKTLAVPPTILNTMLQCAFLRLEMLKPNVNKIDFI